MKIVLRWRKGGLRAVKEPRDRIGEALRRLRRVPYYASPVRRRQIDAGSLDALSPVELGEFLRARELFRDSAARPPVLRIPPGNSPRTAVLGRVFRSQGSVRAFPGGWSQAAADFAPQSLAAPPTQLTHLARIVQAGALTLSTLDHSAIALIEPGGKWPAQEDRDLWWRAFQVPVFEYLTGPGGGVLATECEASDGLHALPGRAVFEMEDGELLVTPLGAEEFAVARLRTGWHVDLLDGPCACGFRGLRLAIGAAPRKVAVAYAG